MKKLHSLAFCALVTPVITFGAGSVLAQETTNQDMDRNQHSNQRDHDTMKSSPRSTQGELNSQRAGQGDSKKAENGRMMGDQSSMQNRGHMAAVPALGMRASDLIGAKVSTAIDKDVGPVDDLIIDQNGQVVAVIVGVGGFLGMGEKAVAIGWDHVTKSGTSGEHNLRVDVTREDLQSAPEFEKQE